MRVWIAFFIVIVCLYCYHKVKELGKSVYSHRLKPPDMRLQRVRNLHSALGEKRQLLPLTCQSLQGHGLLLEVFSTDILFPLLSKEFGSDLQIPKFWCPQNSISLPWISFKNRRQVTYSEKKAHTKALWGQMHHHEFLLPAYMVYVCSYKPSSWNITGTVSFPSLSTTSHSKAPCRTVSENARKTTAPRDYTELCTSHEPQKWSCSPESQP